MRMRSRGLPVLSVLGTAASVAALAGPSAAADCTGELRAQIPLGVPGQVQTAPPKGLGYATQPPADLTTGQVVFGVVTASRDGGCAVPGASASVVSRDVGTAAFSTRRTGTTGSGGYLEFRVVPPRTTYLRGTVAVGEETAQSPPVLRTVRPLVRAAFLSPGGCRMLAEGSTYPAKPDHPVRLQRRITSKGSEAGYTTVQQGVTDADGRFRLVHQAPCGADYALAVHVPASATNTGARSVYVDLHVPAVR